MIVEKSVLSVNHSTESSASCDRASLHVHLRVFFPQHHRFGKDNMQRLAATSEALHLHTTHHIGDEIVMGEKVSST